MDRQRLRKRFFPVSASGKSSLHQRSSNHRRRSNSLQLPAGCLVSRRSYGQLFSRAITSGRLSVRQHDLVDANACAVPQRKSILGHAANASGSATQSWSVAPSGGGVITAVFTYWTSSGATTRPLAFPVASPFPAAFFAQSDGSFARLLGATDPDGTFSILHVPAEFLSQHKFLDQFQQFRRRPRLCGH
jgi:hypothetical protein